MAATASFTPSGTPVTVNLQGGLSQSITLPAPDPANLDIAITNSGSAAVLLSFGGTVPLTFDTPTAIRVPGQCQVLLTANATVLALMVSNPLVLGGPYAQSQAVGAQTATAAMAIAGQSGTITIQRGTAGGTPTFGTKT